MAVTDEEIKTTLVSLAEQRKQLDENIKSLEKEQLSRIDIRLFGVRGLPGSFGSYLEWHFGHINIRHYPDEDKGFWVGTPDFERALRDHLGKTTTSSAMPADVEAVFLKQLRSFPREILELVLREGTTT